MKSISSAISTHNAINAIETSLHNLSIKIIDIDIANLVVEAKKSGNLFSFGNKVYISIREKRTGGIRIYIDAESSSPIQLIDWGANDQIESEIIAELKKYL